MTDPSFMLSTISWVISTGAVLPGISCRDNYVHLCSLGGEQSHFHNKLVTHLGALTVLRPLGS